MAIPLKYNLRSVAARWVSAVVAVLSIAGTVGVFVAMLSLARGFKAAMTASGSPGNALVRDATALAEITGAVELEDVRVIENAPGVARGPEGAQVSAEVVVSARMALKASGTDAMIQVRGVSPKALRVRDQVRLAGGRFFQPGVYELVVGKNAADTYSGLELGDTVRLGGGTWTVVGRFDAGGSAFDSEVWCDANLLNQVYQRRPNIFQSVTIRLTSPAAFREFKDTVTSDPRLAVRADREADYYEQQSHVLTTLILVLGTLVAGVMGIGAVFAALNTMYSAVTERTREIAVLRALGFGEGSVVLSFLFESLVISLVGGALGAAAVLPLNQFTVGTLNFQTFSHLAFAFRVTPDLLVLGVVFALVMGVAGGLPPAVRAARSPISATLRGL
ncbi:MAG: ABC transporter permease [Acidobacteria bacterium]|nr:ABC transporter permease [Acidobacteriota bacterium]